MLCLGKAPARSCALELEAPRAMEVTAVPALRPVEAAASIGAQADGISGSAAEGPVTDPLSKPTRAEVAYRAGDHKDTHSSSITAARST
jgi:hypothetical protein